jgi:hypothetical protein
MGSRHRNAAGNFKSLNFEELAQTYCRDLREEDLEIALENNFVETSPINLSEIELSRFEFLDKKIPQDLQREIIKFSKDILQILKNPTSLGKYLKALNDALPDYSSAIPDDLPLIAGQGYFIPAIWPKDYIPKHKGRVIDKALLEREQSCGHNKEGSQKFIGFIDADSADNFVKEGNIFAEAVPFEKHLFHGKQTHRLGFEIIREAIKAKDLELPKTYQMADLPRLMVDVKFSVKGSHFRNLWGILLDSINETDPSLCFDPKSSEYSFEATSPFVFNSLILCFGKELGLEKLQSCLLDSHWKKMAEIIVRARIDDKNHHEKLSDEEIYNYCSAVILTDGPTHSIGEAKSFNFLPTTLEIALSRSNNLPKYQAKHCENGYIAKKISTGDDVKYQSMAEYCEILRQRITQGPFAKDRGLASNPLPLTRTPGASIKQASLAQGLQNISIQK